MLQKAQIAICDGSGTMVATYVYDAYGVIKSQTGPSSNYFLFPAA